MKIISGGQTGVDRGALKAAKAAGLETGGWMPRGWLSEDGPHPEFAELYGMHDNGHLIGFEGLVTLTIEDDTGAEFECVHLFENETTRDWSRLP
jgi:hypothetical protein